MSKEEILEKVEGYSIWDDLEKNRGHVFYADQIYPAMDEYAKQVAIEFAKWVAENTYKSDGTHYPYEQSEIYNKTDSPNLEIEDLFNLYTDQLECATSSNQ